MRKLLLIIVCLSLLFGNVFAASNEITSMDAQVTVDANGSCRVTVLAEVRFVDRPTTFLFPLGSDAKDIIVSGASYDQKTTDGVKYIVFENESGFSGTISFQCSYTLPCTMRETSNGQHFTAKLPERGWDYPINRYQLTITFPTEITDFPRWQSAYYGDVIDNYLNIRISDCTVTAKSNIVFRDHETLTIDLDFQPDAFVLKHLAEKSVSFDRMIFIGLYAICVLYWLIALWQGRNKQKKNLPFHYQSSAGEIPCQLFGEDVDVGALIAQWGMLGYVALRRTKSNRLRLEKQMDMGNERSAAERRIFHSVFRSLSTIEIPGPRFMAAVHAEAPVLKAHWKHRIFQKNDGRPGLFLSLCSIAGLFFSLMLFDTLLASTAGRWVWIIVLTLLTLPVYDMLQKLPAHWYRPTKWLYAGLGVGFIVILYLLAVPAELGVFLFFNLLLQLGAGYFTRFGGLRTVPGKESLLEILSLRILLIRSNRDFAKEMVRRDSQYYYRTLPYAEILGLGNRFHKLFGTITTDLCPWFIDERNPTPTANDFFRIYKELIHGIRSENRGVIFRSLAKSLAASLPRIRPGFGSGNSSAGSSHNRRSGSTHSRTSGSRRPTSQRRPSSARPSSGRSGTGSSASRRPQTASASHSRRTSNYSGKRS